MRLGVTIVLCIVGVAALAALQSDRSTLSGSVLDTEDGAMPGVSVSGPGT